jgi:hypothetical protein
MDLISWRRMDSVQQIALIADLFVASVFFVIGIRFSIIGLIEEFHLCSPFPITPLPIPDSALAQHYLRYIVCFNCKRSIPADSNLCPYCGKKQSKDKSITLKNNK